MLLSRQYNAWVVFFLDRAHHTTHTRGALQPAAFANEWIRLRIPPGAGLFDLFAGMIANTAAGEMRFVPRSLSQVDINITCYFFCENDHTLLRRFGDCVHKNAGDE